MVWVLGGGGHGCVLGCRNLVMSVIPLETEMRIENNIKKIVSCIFTDNSGYLLFNTNFLKSAIFLFW